MIKHGVIEVHLDQEDGDPLCVCLYIRERNPQRQLRLVGSEQFGPFDTRLEVAQWVWRHVALAMSSSME